MPTNLDLDKTNLVPEVMIHDKSMNLHIQIKPQAKEERVEKIDETHYRVWVKAPAKEGKANEALVETLASYFKVPKSRLLILKGLKSKNKIVDWKR